MHLINWSCNHCVSRPWKCGFKWMYISHICKALVKNREFPVMATSMRPLVGKVCIGGNLWCLHHVARPWKCGCSHHIWMSIIITYKAIAEIVNFGNGYLYQALFWKKMSMHCIHPNIVQYRSKVKFVGMPHPNIPYPIGKLSRFCLSTTLFCVVVIIMLIYAN